MNILDHSTRSLWLGFLRLCQISGFYLVIMTLVRLGLFVSFAPYSELQTSDVFKAFAMGLRFDLVALFYLAAIPTVLLVLLALYKISLWQKLTMAYYSLILTLCTALLLLDFGYYAYFQDHINIMAYGFIEDDTWALVQTMWKNYPVIVYLTFFAVVIYIVIFFVKKILLKPISQNQKFTWSYPLVSFLLVLFVGIGGRGSFGLFPLGVGDTVISSHPFINYLCYNAIHGFARATELHLTQQNRWDINVQYYKIFSAQQAVQKLTGTPVEQIKANPFESLIQKTPKNPWAEKTKPHVVILMMESFGSHWLQHQGADFDLLGPLKKHFEEDGVTYHFFPSINATIGSLSSIMINAPQRPESAFLTESTNMQTSFTSAPAKVFASQGYQTRLIYGGNPGWRDLDKFSRRQGFQKVDGEVDIETSLGKLNGKHDWGIYDEDLFKYVQKILTDSTTPQLLLVMTTTNHPPYQVPDNFKTPELIAPASLAKDFTAPESLIKKRMRAFQYSNIQLADFLSWLKTHDLGQKTLLAVTGDHNFLMTYYSENDLVWQWAVPFYLYTPKAIHQKLSNQIWGSHFDIFPTVYPLALSETEHLSFGVNLLDPKSLKAAMNSSRQVLNSDGAAIVLKNTTHFLRWDAEKKILQPGQATPDLEKLAERYKALMVSMDFYVESESKKQNK